MIMSISHCLCIKLLPQMESSQLPFTVLAALSLSLSIGNNCHNANQVLLGFAGNTTKSEIFHENLVFCTVLCFVPRNVLCISENAQNLCGLSFMEVNKVL